MEYWIVSDGGASTCMTNWVGKRGGRCVKSVLLARLLHLCWLLYLGDWCVMTAADDGVTVSMVRPQHSRTEAPPGRPSVTWSRSNLSGSSAALHGLAPQFPAGLMAFFFPANRPLSPYTLSGGCCVGRWRCCDLPSRGQMTLLTALSGQPVSPYRLQFLWL